VLGFSGPQAREVAQRSSENIRAVSQASTVLARGAQEVSREFLEVVQDRLTKSLEAANRMVDCRSVPDFMAVQSDVARDNLQQVIDTNRRVAEVSLRTSNEASKIIQAASSR
jgi:phasin family protein